MKTTRITAGAGLTLEQLQGKMEMTTIRPFVVGNGDDGVWVEVPDADAVVTKIFVKLWLSMARDGVLSLSAFRYSA